MISITINVSGLTEALQQLGRTPQQIGRALERVSYRAGAMIFDTAKRYAPISPTQSLLNQMRQIRLVNKGYSNRQIRAFRRRGNARKKAMSAQRSAAGQTAAIRPMPGALQNSIQMRNGVDYIEIFVPSNSPAGKYAAKIHDERGKTWQNRGPGTVAKGPQAKEKFIARAITDRRMDIERLIDAETMKALES